MRLFPPWKYRRMVDIQRKILLQNFILLRAGIASTYVDDLFHFFRYFINASFSRDQCSPSRENSYVRLDSSTIKEFFLTFNQDTTGRVAVVLYSIYLYTLFFACLLIENKILS